MKTAAQTVRIVVKIPKALYAKAREHPSALCDEDMSRNLSQHLKKRLVAQLRWPRLLLQLRAERPSGIDRSTGNWCPVSHQAPAALKSSGFLRHLAGTHS